jgi:hypothetical protein
MCCTCGGNCSFLFWTEEVERNEQQKIQQECSPNETDIFITWPLLDINMFFAVQFAPWLFRHGFAMFINFT